MINKLRKKLMVMFLSFTMLSFTAIMLLMANNTIVEIRDTEINYTANIADSIAEQIQNVSDIENLNLSIYSIKFQCWVSISDGISKQSSPEYLKTPSNLLINQIKSRSEKSILSEEGVTEENNGKENIQTVHSVVGLKGEKYYGVHSIFNTNDGSEYDLIVICPKSTLWHVMRNYCSWYPLLWLALLALMYLMGHILIGKSVQPVKAAMKSQKEFIASASHELKAPLAVIQVNAETLHIDKSDTASIQKQKIMLEECMRMSNLIKSMLSLASSDAGNWKMDIRENDVDTLLIEAWEMFLETARKKNIRLNLNIEESYSKLSCDKERMTQVLGILLDNAITYSKPHQSIELGAKVQTKQIVFYVVDHGCGIADTEKERVFERFYSGDSSRADTNHYGLGLSIAQEIVKLHQGNIKLKDTSDGGCTFEISIPFM